MRTSNVLQHQRFIITKNTLICVVARMYRTCVSAIISNYKKLPEPTGAVTVKTKCCNVFTVRRGQIKNNWMPIYNAWKKRQNVTTVKLVKHWIYITCKKKHRVWCSGTTTVGRFSVNWKPSYAPN